MATHEGSYVTETPTPSESGTPQTDAVVETPAAAPAAKKASGGGLGGKVLAELQEIAAGLGIENIQGMRKGALIDAIKAARGDAPAAAAAKAPKSQPAKADQAAPSDEASQAEQKPAAGQADEQQAPKAQAEKGKSQKTESSKSEKSGQDDQDKKADQDKTDKNDGGQRQQNAKGQGNQNNKSGQGNQNQAGQNKGGQNQAGQNQGGQNKGQNQQNAQDDDDEDGNGRRRNRRGRNRNRGMDAEPTYSEDDVLVPAAGILDILDNYAFVRTTGYLPSEQDVYVSLSMVRKWGLRRGDAITGQVRQPREGERKEKFNPMVKVESVNGLTLDDAAKRAEYDQLTAVHPTERIRLDSAAGGTTARTIDLVAPLGKGQRGVIVSPTRAGKTTTIQQVANAITENHAECHLMVVLIDQRPEEVTDFQRSVKGEVISSAFDHAAGDHTTVAELAIERAKRLVELGHDVVVLLDGGSRLGRAYLQSAPGSSRGGHETAALLPARALLGAARNIEDGGSLTILVSIAPAWSNDADDLVHDELFSVSNWSLTLDSRLVDRQIFPAIDVTESGTRHEERFVDQQETTIMRAYRRAATKDDDASDSCCGADNTAAAQQLIERVSSTSSNAEVLLQLNQSLPQG